MFNFPENSIIVEGTTYNFIKKRVYQPVAIYGNDKAVLRIGPPDLIEKEIRFQENLIKHDFPVPKILSRGTFEDMSYFTEESFGEKHIGEILSEDFKKNKCVSDQNFGIILALTKRLVEAQLEAVGENNPESFFLGVHMETILEELPEWKDEIEKCFEKCVAKTKNLSFVLTHGDFNPHNLFERGIIDFGSSFEAPLGYDAISCIFHSLNFPTDLSSEMVRGYQFSGEQVEKYLKAIDEIHKKNGLPPITKYVDDFIFVRTVWSVVVMHKYPFIREWRIRRFGKMMEIYLADQSVRDFVMSYG